MNLFKKTILLITFSFFISFNFVYSYIDPGFGSILIQFLIAGFVGALYCVKVFWRQIKSFTISMFSKKVKDGFEKGE